MGFQLTVAEGKDKGKEFVFDLSPEESVTIGRTSDCDVVLYDLGVSRKHARIFNEGPDYFVEDVGSSNGTKVNGAQIQRHQLATGDRVSLGPVVIQFAALKVEATMVDPRAGLDPDDKTQVADFSPPRSKTNGRSKTPMATASAAARPRPTVEIERKHSKLNHAFSGPHPADVQAPSPGPSRPWAEGPGPLTLRGVQGSARKGSTGGTAVLSKEGGRLSKTPSGSVAGLIDVPAGTGPWAQFLAVWRGYSARTRRILAGLALGVAVTLASVTVWSLVAPKHLETAPIEPTVLTRSPLAASFGVGPGVDFVQPDVKRFTFELNSPLRAVAILHFQAADLSVGELNLSVNGIDLGPVAADAAAPEDRSHAVELGLKLLKRKGQNEISFDNTLSPPGENPWRIWNLWVEVIPLPDLAPEVALRDAQAAFRRGQLNLDRRDIGAANRYQAWREFRAAWLALETLKDPKPDLHKLAREKMDDAEAELDRICGKLLMEMRRAAGTRDLESARGTYSQVKSYFPGGDHGCPTRAEAEKKALGL